MAVILKWTVPVDDKMHEIGKGRVVHIAGQHNRVDEVQIWTEEISAERVLKRLVQVVGTGQYFPGSGEALGSVVLSDGNLVWHVVAFR